MSMEKLVNEKIIFESMWVLKDAMEGLNLNEHERICVLENVLNHEKTVLDRKKCGSHDGCCSS